MRKEYSISARLILDFVLISIFSIAIIILIYVLYTRGENKDFTLFSYIMSALVIYKSYIPYIISLSVYFSFFKGKYLYQESISKVIALPISIIILLVGFYTLYDYYITDFIISKIREHNIESDSKVYYEYKSKLKSQVYERAREELASGNLDKANSFAEDALFYDKNDVNTLLLIKTIQKEKEKNYNKNHQNEVNNVNNLAALGIRQFSLSNYDEAYKYFNKILEIDKYNPTALYYINRISIEINQKPAYMMPTAKEIIINDRLSEAISLYENGNLWKAYEVIKKLYIEAPNIPEINNYYSIIREAVSRYDFFIKEAEEIRDAYVNNPDIFKYFSSFDHNGISLMLDKNILLTSSSSAVFNNSLYIFDVSLIELNKDLKAVRCNNYLYGKIADTFKSSNNSKNIILKAFFDTNKQEHIYSDLDSKIIPINISFGTLNAIKNYTLLDFKYINIFTLFTLRDEITKFGYSNSNINFELLIKIIDPITFLLLFMIIAYYSFRYRRNMFNEDIRIYNIFTGVLGTLLLVLIYKVFINYICILILMISHITIGVIIIIIISGFFILFIILQMARIPRDVR